jgi:hypothetical protein
MGRHCKGISHLTIPTPNRLDQATSASHYYANPDLSAPRSQQVTSLVCTGCAASTRPVAVCLGAPTYSPDPARIGTLSLPLISQRSKVTLTLEQACQHLTSSLLQPVHTSSATLPLFCSRLEPSQLCPGLPEYLSHLTSWRERALPFAVAPS